MGVGVSADLVQWITSTTTVDGVFSALGLGALAVLFATDRILTKGQHERRVADLVKHYDKVIADSSAHHQEVIADKNDRYAELKESRDYWRGASIKDKERADQAVGVVADVAELAKTTNQLLSAFDEAAKEAL